MEYRNDNPSRAIEQLDELNDELLQGVAGGLGVEREMKESSEKGGLALVRIAGLSWTLTR